MINTKVAMRVAYSAAGGVMVLLGLLAVAYGVLFPDMFAIFDKTQSALLGIVSNLGGVCVMVFARRRLRGQAADRPREPSGSDRRYSGDDPAR